MLVRVRGVLVGTHSPHGALMRVALLGLRCGVLLQGSQSLSLPRRYWRLPAADSPDATGVSLARCQPANSISRQGHRRGCSRYGQLQRR